MGTTVTSIALHYNGIRNEGIACLAEALKQNTSVTYIALGDNSFLGNEGAARLAEALKQNTSITHIVFSDNGIRDEGRAQLHKALRRNKIIAATKERQKLVKLPLASVL